MMLCRLLVLWTCASLSASVKVLTWPPLSCAQPGLSCTVSTSHCMDSQWLVVNKYTPSSPEELQVSVETRHDASGHLQPLLLANWTIKDDGSISYLNATEIHVLVMSTNQNLCVRYSFKEKLDMRNPLGKKWSFSANMLVLEPGQRYRVSVFNIPKPELDHSSYDVSTEVIVPDCQDPKMQMTQFCIERGSLWQPNITLAKITAVSGRSELAVSFRPDTLCEEYKVIVSCSTTRVAHVYKANQTNLTVTFSLDQWPRSCCQFDAEIKPLFIPCGQDCTRRRTTVDICPAKPTDAPDVSLYTFPVLGVVILCLLMAVIIYVLYRNSGKIRHAAPPLGHKKPPQLHIKEPPKVLVIYSQDHHLYRDVVLKLCAFLQAKCGTKVFVDLLDSTSVSMVGRLRWLEWQRQQLKNPSDKILVLCSRGVQAKWRAMCGEGRVTLREDVLSPTDDMLTPFLNLFLPDMHQAGMMGKYMVAYFDDISSEQDIPSVFDITVKYKLMKHFEELYFRILDTEKYQPGQVNHIEGIGGEEYCNCPSGRALKSSIETFQAYQFENPDWFEKECVSGEEEIMTEANPLTDHMMVPPVIECVPLIRDGLPVYIHDVEINENIDVSVHALTPEVNTEHELSSVAELRPVVSPECKRQYLSHLDEVLTDRLYPHSPSPESVSIVQPAWNRLPPPRQNLVSLQEEPQGEISTVDQELLLSMSQCMTKRSSVPQTSLHSDFTESSCMQSEYAPPSEISHTQPLENEEDEVLRPTEKGPSSGSDLGYISKMSFQEEPPFKEDPLVALRRLQEELWQQNL